MITPIMLLALLNPCQICSSPELEENHYWVSGKFTASLVNEEFQRQMLDKVKVKKIEDIDLSLVRTITARENSSELPFNYVVRAAYAGGSGVPGSIIKGISLSVDVDSKGIAYITSYRLTKKDRETEISVILSSSIPIKDVVILCGSAE